MTLIQTSCHSRTKFRIYWSHVRISQWWWNINNGAVFEIAAKTLAEKLRRRKECLQKILNLLQARRILLWQVCFLNKCFSIANDIHHLRNAVFFPTRFPSNFLLLCPIVWIRRLANFRFSVDSFIFALLLRISIACYGMFSSKGSSSFHAEEISFTFLCLRQAAIILVNSPRGLLARTQSRQNTII